MGSKVMSEVTGGWIEVIRRHDRDLYASDRANPGLTIRMQQAEDKQDSLEADLKDLYLQRDRKTEHSWLLLIGVVTSAVGSVGALIVAIVMAHK